MDSKKIITCFLLFTVGVAYSQDEGLITEKEDTLVSKVHCPSIEPNQDIIDIEKEHLIHDQLLNRLQGRVAGLDIAAASGSAGASMSSVIRGYNTILNSNSALIVLDGMIIDNSEWANGIAGTDQSNRLIDINPNDIATIKIIRGSFGTVRYGIRGSNGVIELTSKKAQSKGLKIDLFTRISQATPSKLISLQNRFAQGVDNSYRGPETRVVSSWGPEISTLEYQLDPSYEHDSRGRLVPVGTANGNPAQAYDPYDFLQAALATEIHLNIANRHEKLGYKLSLGSNKVNDIIPTSNYTRNSISGNIVFSPSSKLKLAANVRYSGSKANRTIKGADISAVMLGLLRTPPSYDNTNGLSPSEALHNEKAFILDSGGQRSYSLGRYDNPYWTVNKTPNSQNVNRVISNIEATYRINEQLSLAAMTGVDSYEDKRLGEKARRPTRIEGERGYDNQRKHTSIYNKGLVSWTTKFQNKLEFNSELGIDVYSFIRRDKFDTWSKDVSDRVVSTIHVLQEQRKLTIGAFASSSIAYDDFLEFSLAVRGDQSSALGRNNNMLMSYGLSAELDLMSLATKADSTNTNVLQVFIAQGKTGNDIPGSLNRRTYNPVTISGDGWISNTTFNNRYETSLLAQNFELGPEQTQALELGIRTSLLNNRINAGLTLYSEKTTGAVSLTGIDNSSGFDEIYSNNYSISNKGIEIELGLSILELTKVKWSVGAMFSKNLNKVVSTKTVDEFPLLGFRDVYPGVIANQPYGVIMGTSFSRTEKGEMVIGEDGFPVSSGQIQVIGDPNPEWILNLTSELKLANKVSLSGLLEIKRGGDVYCGTCAVLDYLGRTSLAANERNQTTTFEGVLESGLQNQKSVNLADINESTNDFYRVRYGFTGVSEMNIFDASWIRLRQVNLSYKLDNHFAKVSAISGASIGVYATNLLLLTDYPGADPETNLTGVANGRGIDYFNNPNTKSFGVFFKLSL